MDKSTLLSMIDDLIEGKLDAAGVADLEHALRDDASAREQYQKLLGLHLSLAQRVAPVRPFSARELRAVMEVDDRFQDLHRESYCEVFGAIENAQDVDSADSHTPSSVWLSESSKNSNHSQGGQSFWRQALTYGAIAATAAGVLLGVQSWWPEPRGDKGENLNIATDLPQETATPNAPNEPSVIARIVKKVDCVWESDQWSVSSAEVHEDQQINLASGLLVLEFAKGARVTLQGPATAATLSDNSLRLFEGGLTAKVPESAHGFTVLTASGEVIDLGTEFGMMAKSDGSVETHVFEGEVLARSTSQGDQAAVDTVSITEGSARVFSKSGASEQRLAEPERFIRLDFGSSNNSLRPPVEEGLKMWLAADGRVQLDSQSRTMAWGDMASTQLGVLHDAWQVAEVRRPRWDADAIHGKPAIYFGGRKALVTEPFHLSADVTAALVFRLDSNRVPGAFTQVRKRAGSGGPPRPDLGIQLLNLNGPPHAVIQIDENASLKARFHLGYAKNKLYDNDIGVTSTDAVNDDQPHVLLYTFDSENAIARLFLDGRLVSEATDATELASTYSPRYIGNHPYRKWHGFVGHIAEVMLFDNALQPADAGELAQWLCSKYEIPISLD